MRAPTSRIALPFSAASAFAVAVIMQVLAIFSTAGAQSSLARDSLARAIEALKVSADGAALPSVEQFTFGEKTLAAGSTTAGPVAVANGTLHVRGIVNGDVVSYNGDIVVHSGGEVRGNAYAAHGKVTIDGGIVTGDSRSLRGDLTPLTPASRRNAPANGATVMKDLALAGGWLAMLLIVGIAVLVFASTNIDAVAESLERDFGKALLSGIAGQLALLPALAVLVIGLCLTVLGILLIPFAIVAYVLAAAGLITLGYLAMARIAGASVTRSGAAGEREGSLTAMLIGLIILMAPWFIASGLAWSPTGGLIARTVAVAITWVAATVGLGAALNSRGGVRRAPAKNARQAMNTASWQTPTPVAGVAAVRRPTPYSTPVQK
jgi:hypothetical protein